MKPTVVYTKGYWLLNGLWLWHPRIATISWLLDGLIACGASLLRHHSDTVLLADLSLRLLDGAHDIYVQGALLFFCSDFGTAID